LVKIVFALAAASAQASEIVCLAFALGPLMSALGQKQTLFIAIPMSALPPIADILWTQYIDVKKRSDEPHR